jgi:hypothetical protein
MTSAATATSFAVADGFILLYWYNAKKQMADNDACRLGKQLNDESLAHTLYA